MAEIEEGERQRRRGRGDTRVMALRRRWKKKQHRLDETFDTSELLPTIPKIRNLTVNLARRGLRISCPRIGRGRMIN